MSELTDSNGPNVFNGTNRSNDLIITSIIDNTRTPMSVTGEPFDIKNTQYHVCFYNIFHFGDIFFTQPFIKHICDANPNITFYCWFTVGHAAYEGIPNLIHLEPIDDVISSRISPEKNTLVYSLKNKDSYKKFYEFFYEPYPHFDKDFSTFVYQGKSFISFNTWCASLYYTEDMDYIYLLAGFIKKANLLNNIFGLSLNFDFYNHKMFPELPLIPMTDFFSTWLTKNRKKNLVFIYNYEPRAVSFMDKQNMNAIIGDICRSNPHIHIIVPRYDAVFDGIENITCCDRDFGFTENRSCMNLLQIEHILQYCRLVVTLPSGSTWTFLNQHISSYADRTRFYLWGDYNVYAKKINNWYKYGTGKSDDIIKCVGINELALLVRNFNY